MVFVRKESLIVSEYIETFDYVTKDTFREIENNELISNLNDVKAINEAVHLVKSLFLSFGAQGVLDITYCSSVARGAKSGKSCHPR